MKIILQNMLLIDTSMGEIYASLSVKEVRGLGEYLRLNYSHRYRTILDLHKSFVQIVHTPIMEEITMVEYGKRSLGKGYTAAKLKSYLNILLQAVKEFVAIQSVKNRSEHSENIWSEFLTSRALLKNMRINKRNKLQNKNDLENRVESQLNLSKEEILYEVISSQGKDKNRILKAYINNLEIVLRSNRINLLQALTGYYSYLEKNRLKPDSEKEVIAIQVISESKEQSNIIEKLYALNLDAIIHSRDDSINELEKIYYLNSSKLSMSHKNAFGEIIMNYRASQFLNGKENSGYKLYAIYIYLYIRQFKL